MSAERMHVTVADSGLMKLKVIPRVIRRWRTRVGPRRSNGLYLLSINGINRLTSLLGDVTVRPRWLVSVGFEMETWSGFFGLVSSRVPPRLLPFLLALLRGAGEQGGDEV